MQPLKQLERTQDDRKSLNELGLTNKTTLLVMRESSSVTGGTVDVQAGRCASCAQHVLYGTQSHAGCGAHLNTAGHKQRAQCVHLLALLPVCTLCCLARADRLERLRAAVEAMAGRNDGFRQGDGQFTLENQASARCCEAIADMQC